MLFYNIYTYMQENLASGALQIRKWCYEQ